MHNRAFKTRINTSRRPCFNLASFGQDAQNLDLECPAVLKNPAENPVNDSKFFIFLQINVEVIK